MELWSIIKDIYEIFSIGNFHKKLASELSE